MSGAHYTTGGAVAGDTLVLGGSPTGSFAGKDAGTGIDVTVGGLTVTATRDGIKVYGYTLASVSNGPIGTIDPKTITAGLTGTVTKTFDGNTIATLTAGNYTLNGVITGYSVTLNDPTKGTYASAKPGTGIAVTVGGLALQGRRGRRSTGWPARQPLPPSGRSIPRRHRHRRHHLRPPHHHHLHHHGISSCRRHSFPSCRRRRPKPRRWRQRVISSCRDRPSTTRCEAVVRMLG